jgi:hypothetical protein
LPGLPAGIALTGAKADERHVLLSILDGSGLAGQTSHHRTSAHLES